MKKIFLQIIIALFFLTTILSPVTEQLSATGQAISTDQSVIVRVFTDDTDLLFSLNSEIISGRPGKYLDIRISQDTVSFLSDQNIPYTILSTNQNQLSKTIIDTYPTFEEIEQHLQNAASTYPTITDLFSIGKSYEDRDIWCLEISDNPGVDEDEPEVLFMGLHHAREWPTVAITLSLIDELLESYEENSTITDLVDQRRIWIIPCVNPDGYHYDHDLHSGSKWWRKNRHYFSDFHVYGVDLNRNYGGSCNGDPSSMWGSNGISHHPESSVFCGTKPFSELEIKHVQHFFLNHTIDASISWHTYGELVLWPWGYSTTDHAPDDDYMGQIGRAIAEEITAMDGISSYYPTQSSGLYPTTGDTTDWFYGYSHYILGRPHFAYTIEACNEFHPDEVYLEQVCQENIEGAMIVLEEAEHISQQPSRVIPPKITQIDISENDSFVISWEEQNPHADLKKLAVEKLSDYTVFVDQVKEDELYWDLNDFMLTSTRVHSGAFSYHSHVKDGMVSALTSSYPIFVTPNMKLSFWCYYEIEEDYDYAFVELSTNQRTFTKLDSFTGKSNEWVYHEYDLSDYVGQSIFIRFRYFTDANTKENGFWVDDIYPTSSFESISLIDSDITSSPFILTDIFENTTSFIRVKGYNDAYNWGDYSQLYQLSEYTGNSIPTTPVISGEIKGKTDTIYEYDIRSIDQDQDEIYYQIEWGDGNQTEWLGPYQSGESITVEHAWTKDGTYDVKARAKDIHNAISEWGEIEVRMPYSITHPILYHILQMIEWFRSLL